MYIILDEGTVRQNLMPGLATSISVCYQVRLGIYDGMAH